jgi:hypothetical protein
MRQAHSHINKLSSRFAFLRLYGIRSLRGTDCSNEALALINILASDPSEKVKSEACEILKTAQGIAQDYIVKKFYRKKNGLELLPEIILSIGDPMVLKILNTNYIDVILSNKDIAQKWRSLSKPFFKSMLKMLQTNPKIRNNKHTTVLLEMGLSKSILKIYSVEELMANNSLKDVIDQLIQQDNKNSLVQLQKALVSIWKSYNSGIELTPPYKTNSGRNIVALNQEKVGKDTVAQFLKQTGWQPQSTIDKAHYFVDIGEYNKAMKLGDVSLDIVAKKLGSIDSMKDLPDTLDRIDKNKNDVLVITIIYESLCLLEKIYLFPSNNDHTKCLLEYVFPRVVKNLSKPIVTDLTKLPVTQSALPPSKSSNRLIRFRLEGHFLPECSNLEYLTSLGEIFKNDISNQFLSENEIAFILLIPINKRIMRTHNILVNYWIWNKDLKSICQYLECNEVSAKRSACKILGKITKNPIHPNLDLEIFRCSEIIDALHIILLKESINGLNEDALLALVNLADSKTIPYLLEQRLHKSKTIRDAVQNSLKRLKVVAHTKEERITQALAKGEFWIAAKQGPVAFDMIKEYLDREYNKWTSDNIWDLVRTGDSRAIPLAIKELKYGSFNRHHDTWTRIDEAFSEILKNSAANFSISDLNLALQIMNSAVTSERYEVQEWIEGSYDMDPICRSVSRYRDLPFKGQSCELIQLELNNRK